MIPALLLALVVQQPQVTAAVDRTELSIGDTLRLTIRVETTGNERVRIVDPVLDGLVLDGAREGSDVRLSGGATARRTTRVLRLRAVRAGRAGIGVVRVQQGTATVEAAAIAVTVTPAAAEPALDPAVGEVLARAALPDSSADLVVTLLPSRTSVVLGDQVELVTVAWFRREVRTRMRAPPTFEGPEVQGAWSYRHATPAGMVTSRRVGSAWYDLFAQHETVFPLRAGPLPIGRASVSYSFPLTYSFLSREVRHVVASDSLVLLVTPHPEAGQPAGFSGAAGVDLTFRVDPAREDLAVGEARTIVATLSGEGNVALWPEPEIRWPVGLRVYPGDVSVSLSRETGAVGGTKTFHYLLVADSAGRYRISAPAYPYFDLADGRYVELRGAGLEIVARLSPTGVAPRTTAPPLMAARASRLPRPTDAPGWLWGLLGVLPPLLLTGRWIRLRPGGRVVLGREPGDRLARLDREFRRELDRLVPHAGHRDAAELSDALRAAGLETPHAAHVARVRDRLRLGVYGPGGATDADELGAEVQEVLQVLLGRPGRGRGAGGLSLTLALGGLLATVPARAQDLSPERLYAAGAARVAVDSFVARAAAAPHAAAHWYNLGSAWYVLGSDVRARVAWLRAARLAPRDRLVRRALALVPTADPATACLEHAAAVTPDEALLAAAGFWLLGCAVLLRSRRRAAAALLCLAVIVAAYGVLTARRYRAPVALILDPETPLREAPYGSAPSLVRLREGTGVIIRDSRSGWLLVAEGERRGWVHRAEVIRL